MELENETRDNENEPMVKSNEPNPAQPIPSIEHATLSTAEAPRVEQFAFHLESELSRTLEVSRKNIRRFAGLRFRTAVP